MHVYSLCKGRSIISNIMIVNVILLLYNNSMKLIVSIHFCSTSKKCFLLSLLSKWFNDSFYKVAIWLIPDWIAGFEQIRWMNDSTDSLNKQTQSHSSASIGELM